MEHQQQISSPNRAPQATFNRDIYDRGIKQAFQSLRNIKVLEKERQQREKSRFQDFKDTVNEIKTNSLYINNNSCPSQDDCYCRERADEEDRPQELARDAFSLTQDSGCLEKIVGQEQESENQSESNSTNSISNGSLNNINGIGLQNKRLNTPSLPNEPSPLQMRRKQHRQIMAAKCKAIRQNKLLEKRKKRLSNRNAKPQTC